MHCRNTKINILYIFILLLFFINTSLYSQATNNSLKNRMDDYAERVKMQWEYNPFKNYATDRYFSSWVNPDAYNSKFWIGDIFNIKDMYPNKNFTFDEIQFFYQPTLATEVTPISFRYNEKHRFKIGVGYLTHFFLSKYKEDVSKYYGQSLLYGIYMQVEVFFDYIYNNTFKFRFSPLKHICSHISGDILGDETLYDKSSEEFRDAGFEQMSISAYYKYGWFTFYGGTDFAITGFKKSNFVNLLKVFYGTDIRVPIWGEISFISGIYLGANFDKINTVKRGINEYILLETYNEWTPAVSAGIGIEIYRIIIGVKYQYERSKQLYAFRKMENKIGFEASLYL